jgi:hypothetical protein
MRGYVCVSVWSQPALGSNAMEGGAAQTGTDRMGYAAAALVRARTHQEPIALSGLLPLVINNKENGFVHRLSEGSRTMARDQRRTLCGWQAGGATANARFCNTSLWPPLGVATTRLCSKCFPSADVVAKRGALSDDPVVDTV